jgi:predicted lipoprotein with Yx(FWY)xxD motif
MKNPVIALTLFLVGIIFLSGCNQIQSPPITPIPAPTTVKLTEVTTIVETPTQVPSTVATPPNPDSIMVTVNAQYGQILTDMDGYTLYYLAEDTPGAETSACTQKCLDSWSPFNVITIQVSPPLQADDFNIFPRADGIKQVTYQGWPLYHYYGDQEPGDTNGNDVNGTWYVMGVNGVVTLTPTPTLTSNISSTTPTPTPTPFILRHVTPTPTPTDTSLTGHVTPTPTPLIIHH